MPRSCLFLFYKSRLRSQAPELRRGMFPAANDLYYFQEAVSSQNLSRAAERLGISQPSLTMAIQRLEHSIGAPLLVRSKKGVVPTQAGKQLFLHARQLLQLWETTKGSALASTQEVQGSYTIGCHPSVALYTLGKVIPNLLERYPELELKVKHDLSRKIAEAVVRMEVDIAVVVNPARHPDLVIRKLCNDEVGFWVGPGKKAIQDWRSGDAVLVCEPDLLQTQDLLKKLKKSNIQYKRVLTSSNLEVVTDLVASGAGVGIIPGKVVEARADAGLKRLPESPIFKDEICLLYRVENRSVRAIQTLSGAIVKAFA